MGLDVKITVLKKAVYFVAIKLFGFIRVFMVKSITNAKNAEELITNKLIKNQLI